MSVKPGRGVILRTFFLGRDFHESFLPKTNNGDEPPLRAELFNADQMEQHGKTLAISHRLGPGHTADRLLNRLAENEVILKATRDLLAVAVREERRITPAGEWLLDNFYLLEEQIHTARRHLPRGYSRELPCLLVGRSAQLPRVYDIAQETISHGDGRLDAESLHRFLASYQTITTLQLGELWAVPIMLRLALIENLRRVSVGIAADRTGRNCADYWADRMLKIAETDPKSLILLIADMARSDPPMVSSFVAELARRLQGQSPALALPLTWIEQRLSEDGLTIEQLIQVENQRQAADQVSISNSIGSFRLLGATDWREFVEALSAVEQVLRLDPGGVYGRMNFATRDAYRHVIERIAKQSPLSQREVSQAAIRLAIEAGVEKGGDDRGAHVGFYLVDQGLPRLERAVRMDRSIPERIRGLGRRIPLTLYAGSVVLLTAAVAAGLWTGLDAAGPFDVRFGLFLTITLLCASHLAVSLVNWLATLLVVPRLLPRMDFSHGIPLDAITLVVVPTMLECASGLDRLIEAMEVRFLANRDDNLRFGLLTDFPDAATETCPGEEPLLQLASLRVKELNERYKGSGSGPFFLFHRPRRWNPRDGIWMGYERKRGKLGELNALLRGHGSDRFSVIVGNRSALTHVKYVITLDSDTQLPRDSARECIGAMAHPLNRAVYDSRLGRVREGYGILQPRVVASLPGANRSIFARLSGGEAGIDPYTRAVSDVYQDVFGEGSFIGKGIYDVDAFERALNNRLPENRILSHDLLEGCYARSGLLSDVQFFEADPSLYSADASRRRRWIRGDWQIARWLLPRVPGFRAGRRNNPLTGLSRWKILDNLRRSLVPGAMTILLLAGWTWLSPAWIWTAAVIGLTLLLPLLISLLELFRVPEDVLWRQHWPATLRSARRRAAQATLTLAFLPYEAFFSLGAALRSIWRMMVSHRRLLEWSPSRNGEARGSSDLIGSFRSMWIGPVIALATAIFLAFSRPDAFPVAAPLMLLWLGSPVVAWWISRPFTRRGAVLTGDQHRFLKRIARRTWAYFETFVGPEDHWLPPDNFQELPAAAISHRTSPTNMGLALLANLAAYDFGYIPAGQFLERTTNAFDTMTALKRYHGHFYNWYDTQSLDPLPPRYVSTVDSGNLAGHLLTLRPGLLALPDQEVVAPRLWDGLGDTLGILSDILGNTASVRLGGLSVELESVSRFPPTTLEGAHRLLERLANSTAQLAHGLEEDSDLQGGGREAAWWARALAAQCQRALDELLALAPWILLPAAPKRLAAFPGIEGIPSLRVVAGLDTQLLPVIERSLGPAPEPGEADWFSRFQKSIIEASRGASARLEAIGDLVRKTSELACSKYDFLFDKTRHLLAIGYNAETSRRDPSYYDLLASESRLSSFVAIAQGQLPQESWFALGRLLAGGLGDPLLLSWSGSMFEYLMPVLVMPTYENTLLDQTCKAAVRRQIDYGKERGVPWGISESGYNAMDHGFNYQYRAFGVPGLGLKRGLAEDLVIAPYASELALMIAPEEACINLQRLAGDGLEGRYGFYEAIDYTPSRLTRGESSAIIRSFMAHHQGMSFLALAYALLDRPMQKRFESDPLFQATSLLLQERIPRTTPLYARAAELSDLRTESRESETPVRVFTGPDSPAPEVQLLSNGRYHVMITNAGGGFSRWKDLAVTRWREDTTRDPWGTFCYIRDLASGEFWSTAFQPTPKRADSYEAIFSQGRAEFRRRDQDLDTHTQVAVSPEDDIELRQITVRNRGRTRRVIDLTSYAEVVLASPASDALHPAFSNLFVQSEYLSARKAILCRRRPRSVDEPTPWMFHLIAAHGEDTGEVTFETDRMEFIGRGNTIAHPRAMTEIASSSGALSGHQGPVLDPIVALRYRLALAPGASTTINFVTGISETRNLCLGLVEKYQDPRLSERVFDLASTHSQVVLQQLNATEADAQLYGRLAGSVLYPNAFLRADPGVLVRNRRGQSGLWGHAISGDLPIVLLRIGDEAHIDLVRRLVQAHAHWRLKGLAVDLVIWNEEHAGYRQLLHEQILGLIAAGVEANVTDRPGGIFVRLADQLSNEDRILFQSVARVTLSGNRGTLAEQLSRRNHGEVRTPRLVPTRAHRPEAPGTGTGDCFRPDLIFFNGLGGFTPDGREYVIRTAPGQETPVPWVNVLANAQFGTVISESGLAYTWSENAHEFRLTPWSNDPVGDSSGEALYLRDEESGHFWSPSPRPSPGTGPYLSRHGFGYSIFEHLEDGIATELSVYVALDAPVKFSVLKVRNQSGRSRRLSAAGYVEWVLGDLGPKSAMHVITEVDAATGAVLARNPYNTEFSGRVAFFDSSNPARTVSGDRGEFLGRNGVLSNPAAMRRSCLSGRVGAALDPCAAIHVPFEVAAGQEVEIIFILGVGRTAGEAGQLVSRFRGSTAAHEAIEAVWHYWKHTLGAVHVETPDPSVNVLANGWLVYQTLACRLWARSGFYQSGGAFGFRDQLQDAMALIHTEPQLLRDHLLLSAARQFQEGDVQHWWHPPSGRGVRTHCSDDFLWLPLAACRYVLCTADTGVLDERIPFLEGRKVSADEDSYYDLPGRSEERGTLYEHCVRAILRGLPRGEHGLPLIGSGDWNDSMNRVGARGKGESIWLAFFLYEVLTQFTEVARIRGDLSFAEKCRTEAVETRRSIEQHAWDGEWYLRAFFDDGVPLGSAESPEGQIDSIVQSWSVLSGAVDRDRARRAMEAVDRRLVRRESALIQLLDPPYDQSPNNPGYITGYPPGVRENGGQYTHAAIWTVMAFAAMGDRKRAWELMALINPVNHASSPEKMAIYKAEPYVVAADVYARPPHTGRGGWTWYTGSAGWMYRLMLESLLGLRRTGDALRIEPCLPNEWESFKIHYRFRETVYHIDVMQTRTGEERSVQVDGVLQPDHVIPLVDDGREHSVEVRTPAGP